MFQIGDLLYHSKGFGYGRVVEVRMEDILVEFDGNVGLKILQIKSILPFIFKVINQSYYFYNSSTFTWIDKNKQPENVINKSQKVIPLNYLESKLRKDNPFTFDGFYHMTHINNLRSIVKAKKIFSRDNVRSYIKFDMAEKLELTRKMLGMNSLSEKFARFYFRPRVPTFSYFEDYTVVLLKFSKDIINLKGAKMSLGNASYSKDIKDTKEIYHFSVDFNYIFSEHNFDNESQEWKLSQSELLVPNYVDIKYLKTVYFKNSDEMLSFTGQYGPIQGVGLHVGQNLFSKGARGDDNEYSFFRW